MRVAIYTRCSTSQHQSTEAQVDELTQYASSRGWKLVKSISDEGYSGSTDQRPGLKQLLALVRARKVDCVVVTKLDRIARSLKHLVAILDELRELNVQFVSIHDHVDLTTSSGRLMLHIIAAFAEFERSLIRERTVLGLAHAKSKGKRLGRPLKRDDVAIRSLRAQGLSYTEIQDQLKISKGAVCRAIGTAPKTPQKLTQKAKLNQGAK